ncbi:MAG: ATP-binding protein [Synergistaceae bacterium]|jgi:predicted AAA+ superfamily ATPase|nr:ATP-binding protein [Synergistaceae bacterium]
MDDTYYIARRAEKTIIDLAKGFPIVALTGPRQSGKTTLARRVFGDRPYVSLEDPDNREFAANDPRGFLGRYGEGAIFDEVQRVPELFSWLQGIVDNDGRMGRFILTGSQQFGFMEGITQSLAGRIGELSLLPLCLPELREAGYEKGGADQVLYDGFYPAVHVRDVEAEQWYNSYIGTYLERDVRSMTAVKDLSAFQTFLKLAAGRCGQILNFASLGASAGVTHNTAKAWLSVLQASFIIFLLRPFHRNYNKRLIKAPKLYFYDTGLVSRLLGLTIHEQLPLHPLRGAIFENFVISETLKSFYNSARSPQCFFWRDSAGHEVDMILEENARAFPVEIKSGKTVASDFFDGLRRWEDMSGAKGGALVYGGDENYEREGFNVVSWDRAYDIGIRNDNGRAVV